MNQTIKRVTHIVLCGLVLLVMTGPVGAEENGLLGTTGSVERISTVYSGGMANGIHSALPLNDFDAWKKNLTADEKKLPSAILVLTSPPDKVPKGFDIQKVKKGMNTQNQLRKKGESDLVHVYIQVEPGYSTSMLDPVVTEVVARDEAHHRIAAWIDLSKSRGISKMKGVQLITLVSPPRSSTGSVTTEGDAILHSDLVRGGGSPTGEGIKVGVISDGINSLADAVVTGDLPADVQVLSDDYIGDEGTALSEIIHDIAPNASLAFADWADDEISFAQHMQDLADAGCDVIVDDIIYFSEPAFEDGVIAEKADELYASNVLMVSSAGNEAYGHSIGPYTPLEETTWHDFSSVGDASIAPTPDNPYLYAKVEPGQYLIAVLQWDDKWGDSGNDYDLYLVNLSNEEEEFLDYSINAQTGFQNPFEITYFGNDGNEPVDVGILVDKWNGDVKTLDVYLFGTYDIYTNNLVPASSIYGHACSEGTMGVGAVPVSDPDTIEWYSSHGPRPISYPSVETREKPDITATDGVLISGAGDFGYWDGSNYRFYGTSAAAPHVAGIGALLWSIDPTGLSASRIREAMTSTADDLGAAGYDFVYGYGRVNASAAYQTLPQPPTADFLATPTSGTAPLQVFFTDQSTGSPASWAWDFDNDGITDNTTRNASFTYQTPGSFTVNLTVTNTAGSDSEVRTGYIIASEGITVVAPNGGETFYLGGLLPMKWTYTNSTGSSVNIEVFRNGTLFRVIPSVPIGSGGSGSYNVTIPSSTPPGTDYTIRVVSASTPSYFDTSDGSFSISVPTITVMAPDGGEHFTLGNPLPFSWTFTGNPGPTVNIDVLRGPAILKTLVGIPAGSGGFGSYTISTIPYNTPLGGNFTIRVTSTTYVSCTDASNGEFSISGPTITVQAPDGGEVYPLGSPLLMNWTYTGNPGPTVNIDVLKGNIVLKTLPNVPIGSGGSGSFMVPAIPSYTPLGGDYTIRVTSTNYGPCTDTSNGNFTISAA
ncbi:MAG: Tk-subtilisin precursor [Euryarchaeota archaeon ADurb.BinA087]|nr:MAG: Tk-subtilisin precursor [Euryarchaeota archaeon ADurb.BinA087]